MAENNFKYVIVGGGLAGCYAIDGIRSQDSAGSVLLISMESYLPYDRPPLTKKLWFGKKKVEDIFIRDRQYFVENGTKVLLETQAVSIDAANKTVTCEGEETYHYEKLLLATGGTPRRLNIEGSDRKEIYYYRYLDDYLRLKSHVSEGTNALVIGGGFIGSEIAAALNVNKVHVTILMDGPYLVDRVFPRSVGTAIQQDYVRRGVKILSQDSAVSITKRDHFLSATTKSNRVINSDVVIVGIGIEPSTELAESASLEVGNGIVVNEFLETSNKDIYAAGDNACFPYQVLGIDTRVEHWDNAINQGKTAGMNMAGAHTPYNYMPYFFSDLFDFGYEAVGLVSSQLQTYGDWEKENEKGILYYIQDSQVRGAMMCNVWNKVNEAREWIRSNKQISLAKLRRET
ncbi:MAG: FAD-dependent oxidoreductase [Sedimentisphaerales bacterium]